jgi:octopine/nopaline transport system permease protein
MRPTDPFVLLGFGEGGWGAVMLAGTLVTLEIAVLAYLFGCLIGLLAAWAKIRGPRWLRLLAEGYTTVIQGLPDILVILIVYYGGTSAIRDVAGLLFPGVTVEIDAFAAGVASLAIIAGSYATEIFRAAFLSVPKGQTEAATSLGLRPAQVFRLVLGPQAFRKALPPLGNMWLVTLKDAALVSVVGLRDLVGVAASGAAFSRQPFTFYFAVAVVFLVLSAISMLGLAVMEKRLARSDRRA